MSETLKEIIEIFIISFFIVIIFFGYLFFIGIPQTKERIKQIDQVQTTN